NDRCRKLLLRVFRLEILRRQIHICWAADLGLLAADQDLFDPAALLGPGAARDTDPLRAEHLELGSVGAGLVIRDDARRLLLAEEVGPRGVETEGIVGYEANGGEEGYLGGQEQTDTAEYGAPVPLGQTRPEP